MTLSMGLSAMTKSEATGGLLAVSLLIFNMFAQGVNTGFSPLFNPIARDDVDAAAILARLFTYLLRLEY